MVLAILAAVVAACPRRNDRNEESWTPARDRRNGDRHTRARPPADPPASDAGRPANRGSANRLGACGRSPDRRADPRSEPRDHHGSGCSARGDIRRDRPEQGATLENVGVEFTADGRMILTAGRVGYGFVNADNVTLIGRLIALDGRLELETESISPRGHGHLADPELCEPGIATVYVEVVHRRGAHDRRPDRIARAPVKVDHPWRRRGTRHAST